MDTTDAKPDIPLVALMLLVLALGSLFLAHAFSVHRTLLFLVGAGLGITLFHASFGFAGGWRNFVRQRDGAAVRAQLLLLGASSVLFFPLFGNLFPQLHVSAAVAPAGISVLAGAFIFGIGMQLGGGCGSGTLYTVGGGHVRMLITLAFFVVGTVVGSIHLSWWLSLPNMGRLSLIESLGWLPALCAQILVLALLYAAVSKLERKRELQPGEGNVAGTTAGFVQRLARGPWPLGWGVAALALLGLATLLIAGHPWSITFAFGLWGTKIWSALGGDISGWSYWNGGYPAAALERSVLADTTSLMDFGIILGAVLAAGLAGRFAPASRLRLSAVMSAVLGGLLLGYGARLAFGCNIGGLLAGIASGSVHGWLWLVSGFAGSVLGVRLRVAFGMDKPMTRRT